MTSAEPKAKRAMPRGGRKGGVIFPRIPLSDALSYAKKLVSKTHTGAQAEDVIHSGVVGAKGGTGAVRISALKQYGFLNGDREKGFGATEDAKKTVSAPPEEVTPLYQVAALRPTVFKAIFNTYQGDVVSRAKLKQRAADLRVHPDETETCVDIYVKSLELAKLVTVDGDQVTHTAAGSLSEDAALASSEASTESSTEDKDESDPGTSEASDSDDLAATTDAGRPRAVFNVNVTLDSSLDIEKLAKQLELLKRFGAI